MNKILKYSLIIILPFMIYFQVIAFLFLDFALQDNVHMMSRAELVRYNYDTRITNEQFQSFQKTKYLKLYNNSKNADSVTYYYKLMDSIYLKEMRDSIRKFNK